MFKLGKKKQKPTYQFQFQKEAKEIEKMKHTLEFPKTIAICSLIHSCGCSYFTRALEKYLLNKDKKVFIVKDGIEPEECEDYDILIYDFSSIENAAFETLKIIKRCEKKVMLGNYSEEYLKKLALFINNDLKFTHSWLFLFNFVAESKKQELKEIMEGYQYACVPLFSNSVKDIEKMLNEVWL